MYVTFAYYMPKQLNYFSSMKDNFTLTRRHVENDKNCVKRKNVTGA